MSLIYLSAWILKRAEGRTGADFEGRTLDWTVGTDVVASIWSFHDERDLLLVAAGLFFVSFVVGYVHAQYVTHG